MNKAKLIIMDDGEKLASHAAELLAEAAEASIEERGRFALVLSGGYTPKKLFTQLASGPLRDRIRWPDVFFFWGDERCVPPDHEDSNFGLARETLLGPLDIRPDHVFRMKGELPPEEAAAAYQKDVESFFSLAPGTMPYFDLSLMGMGPDGHTASLFPETKALDETRRICTSVWVAKLNAHRLTLTVPVFCQARQLLFIVSGHNKSRTMGEIFDKRRTQPKYPIEKLLDAQGAITFIVDRAAASEVRGVLND